MADKAGTINKPTATPDVYLLLHGLERVGEASTRRGRPPSRGIHVSARSLGVAAIWKTDRLDVGSEGERVGEDGDGEV